MRRAPFAITNRAELHARARIEAIRDRVVEAIAGEAPSASGVWEPLTEGNTTEWIVFHDQNEAGFGISVDDGASVLQRELSFARHVASIVRRFRDNAEFPLKLSLRREIPESWRGSELRNLRGVVRFSSSETIPTVAPIGKSSLPRKLTRIRLCACVKQKDEISEEWSARVGALEVFATEVGMKGLLRCEEGGEMSIEVKEMEVSEEQMLPGVRIDLGELEVSLSDLAALRPGAVINLGAVEFDRCYIRIGSEVLAEGLIRCEGGELLITVQAVGGSLCPQKW